MSPRLSSVVAEEQTEDEGDVVINFPYGRGAWCMAAMFGVGVEVGKDKKRWRWVGELHFP